jgi:hypothetical protein
MKLKRLVSVTLAFTLAIAVYVHAQESPQPHPSAPSSAQPTAEQILAACAQNQADTLPNPFVDVTPTDWAYKSVLTLYYCGAYRGAISPQQYQDYMGRN